MCKKIYIKLFSSRMTIFFWRFMHHLSSWMSWFRGASSWSSGIHTGNPRKLQAGICSLLSVFWTLLSEFTASRPTFDLASSYLNLLYHKSYCGGKTVELSRSGISDYLLSCGQETASRGTAMWMMKQLILCGKILHASMQPESCCTLGFKFGPSTGPLMKMSLLLHCLTYCILYQVSNLRSLPFEFMFCLPKTW